MLHSLPRSSSRRLMPKCVSVNFGRVPECLESRDRKESESYPPPYSELLLPPPPPLRPAATRCPLLRRTFSSSASKYIPPPSTVKAFPSLPLVLLPLDVLLVGVALGDRTLDKSTISRNPSLVSCNLVLAFRNNSNWRFKLSNSYTYSILFSRSLQ